MHGLETRLTWAGSKSWLSQTGYIWAVANVQMKKQMERSGGDAGQMWENKTAKETNP